MTPIDTQSLNITVILMLNSIISVKFKLRNTRNSHSEFEISFDIFAYEAQFFHYIVNIKIMFILNLTTDISHKF